MKLIRSVIIPDTCKSRDPLKAFKALTSTTVSLGVTTFSTICSKLLINLLFSFTVNFSCFLA